MSNPKNPLMDPRSNLRNCLCMVMQIVSANQDREIRLTEDSWKMLSDVGWVTCVDVEGAKGPERRFVLTKLGKREMEAQERWARQQGAAQALGIEGGA